MPFISCLSGVKFNDAVARGVDHGGSAHYGDSLAVDGRTAQMTMSKEMILGFICIVNAKISPHLI